MIPLKLSLENFLCYRDGLPTLDLEGVHLACLCGQNGHGKSALLDAITWALWGRARSKSNDELIHYGADHMWVELEFMARDARYRVVRRQVVGRGRRRQGSSDLQLQVSSAEDFVPITGNTVRETQSRLDQIIGMDYDTFINSAFLLQGRADEFTNKPPGERKEVLAKILELGTYDRLQERARRSGEERKVAGTMLQADLERMGAEVARAGGYAHDLTELELRISEVSRDLEGSRTAHDALKMKVDDLARMAHELEDLKGSIPLIERDISNLQSQIKGARGRIEADESLIQQRDEIRLGLAHLKQLREGYQQLNEARDRFDQLAGRKAELEPQVADARARLEERVSQLNQKIERQLRPKAEAIPEFQGKLVDAHGGLEQLVVEAQAVSQERLHLQDLAGQVGHYQAVSEQLKSEGQDLRSKLNLVRNTDGAGECPLCGTALGHEGCQHLAGTYEKLMREKLDQYQQGQVDLKRAENDAQTLGEMLPQREQDISRRQQAAQGSLAKLQIRLTDSQAAATEMEQLQSDILRDELQLDQKLFAADQHQELAHLEGEISSLSYDQNHHRQVYEEMDACRPFEERHRLLEDVEQRLPQERELVTSTSDILSNREADLKVALARSSDIQVGIVDLDSLKTRMHQAEDSRQSLEHQLGDMLRRQGELQGSLRKLEQTTSEMDGKTSVLTITRNEHGVYQDLAEAFGRRGVQAMLIETVLPRIEEEANALLDRMTDGRMHLKLESQRERRSGRGEPIETLEIVISDEIGPRSYELFSGGEAFRINLALRIALSKVLANRKGAPLPTLFIDEGFGTQDTVGRERILDVISAIQDDFEKIIVISHLDEIREAFPVRIEVQKEESGSTFWIS